MKKRMLCGLFAVIASVVCACFIFVSHARTPGRTLWAGELEAGLGGITSDLLSAEGQNVTVTDHKNSYSFSITVHGGFIGEGRTAYLSASTDGTVDAELGMNEVYIEEGQTVNVDLAVAPIPGGSGNGSAEVTLVCGDTVLSGTFTVPLADEEHEISDTSGQIAYCPKWYNKNVPIKITVGASPVELQCNGDVFPAMTSYRINGVETVLFDGGVIPADAGSVVEIDLSETSFYGEYLMINTLDRIFNLKSTPIPTAGQNGEAILMTSKDQVLPTVYSWENCDPEITVEQLVAGNNGSMSWKIASGFTAKESENGFIELSSGDSVPGTYRVTAVWKDKGYDMYTLEIPVYLRFE